MSKEKNRTKSDTILTSIKKYQKKELRLDELKEKINNAISLNAPYHYSVGIKQKTGNIVDYCVDHNLTEVLELVLKSPNIEINRISSVDGKSPLINACINGNQEAVELLLNACPKSKLKTLVNQLSFDTIPKPGYYGLWVANNHPIKTPLIYAILGEHREIVKMLLANGAKCNIKDNEDKTAFDYAYDNGDMKIASAIARKSSLYNYLKVKYTEFKIYYNSTKVTPDYDYSSVESKKYNIEMQNQEFVNDSNDSVVELYGKQAYNTSALETEL